MLNHNQRVDPYTRANKKTKSSTSSFHLLASASALGKFIAFKTCYPVYSLHRHEFRKISSLQLQYHSHHNLHTDNHHAPHSKWVRSSLLLLFKANLCSWFRNLLNILFPHQTVRPAQSSVIIDRISKRAAYFGGEPARDNSYHKSANKDSPCDDSGVLVMRPCSYEECLESKYPYVGYVRFRKMIEKIEKINDFPLFSFE